MAANSSAAWNSGLCGCFSDCSTCCYGFWCLPCLYGENSSKVHDGGSCFGPCLLYSCCPMFTCCFAGGTRTDLRNKHKLQQDPCSDCCVHCWCSPCAVCQEARELTVQIAKAPAQHIMVAPAAQRMS